MTLYQNSTYLLWFLEATGTVLTANSVPGIMSNLPSVGQLCPWTYRVSSGNLAGLLFTFGHVGFSNGHVSGDDTPPHRFSEFTCSGVQQVPAP